MMDEIRVDAREWMRIEKRMEEPNDNSDRV